MQYFLLIERTKVSDCRAAQSGSNHAHHLLQVVICHENDEMRTHRIQH